MAGDNESALRAKRNSGELNDLMTVWARRLKIEINVSAPGKVVAYNPTTNKATIEVAFKPVRYVNDGEQVGEAFIIPGVPVEYLASTTAKITIPIPVGTTGRIQVQDRSLRKWKQDGQASDPALNFLHNLGDAVFIPGLRPDSLPLQSPAIDQTAMVLDEVLVKIGENATEEMVKATTFIALMDTALAAASAAGTGAPGTTGKLAFDAFIVAWNAAKANIKATKGRVE